MAGQTSEDEEDEEAGPPEGQQRPVEGNEPEAAETAPSTTGQAEPVELGEADLDLLESIQGRRAKAKPKRPEYKFHKKPARSKGTRGKADDGPLIYDGSAMKTGKHGGLLRSQ